MKRKFEKFYEWDEAAKLKTPLSTADDFIELAFQNKLLMYSDVCEFYLEPFPTKLSIQQLAFRRIRAKLLQTYKQVQELIKQYEDNFSETFSLGLLNAIADQAVPAGSAATVRTGAGSAAIPAVPVPVPAAVPAGAGSVAIPVASVPVPVSAHGAGVGLAAATISSAVSTATTLPHIASAASTAASPARAPSSSGTPDWLRLFGSPLGSGAAAGQSTTSMPKADRVIAALLAQRAVTSVSVPVPSPASASDASDPASAASSELSETHRP